MRLDAGASDAVTRDVPDAPASLDGSTFVCRVAIEVLGTDPNAIIPEAGWLMDHLIAVEAPQIGDVVGYERPAIRGASGRRYDWLHYVMLYAGNGTVIGVCETTGRVINRPIDYRPALGARRWRLVRDPPSPFRQLRLR